MNVQSIRIVAGMSLFSDEIIAVQFEQQARVFYWDGEYFERATLSS